jgi:hypothetical protein
MSTSNVQYSCFVGPRIDSRARRSPAVSSFVVVLSPSEQMLV